MLKIVIIIISTVILTIFIDRVIIPKIKIKGKRIEPINQIPTELPKISGDDDLILKYYIEEWKTVIQTQMHFNDLIIRFRSITLTAFASFIAGIFVIQKTTNISLKDLLAVILIVLIFWVTVGILDFFYYFRLLLGAVSQGLKFDQSEYFKKMGLFGLTTNISNHIHPPASRLLIFFYYALPLVSVGAILILKYYIE